MAHKFKNILLQDLVDGQDCPLRGSGLSCDVQDATDALAQQQAYSTLHDWCTIKELGL